MIQEKVGGNRSQEVAYAAKLFGFDVVTHAQMLPTKYSFQATFGPTRQLMRPPQGRLPLCLLKNFEKYEAGVSAEAKSAGPIK